MPNLDSAVPAAPLRQAPRSPAPSPSHTGVEVDLSGRTATAGLGDGGFEFILLAAPSGRRHGLRIGLATSRDRVRAVSRI